jgi:8-oxo-dGTP pyrophosphatase MutT (NUDIX family)
MLTHTLFRFCPACGRGGIVVFEKNGMQCTSCGYVYFHNCASAVAAIIETRLGILYTKRNHAPKKGLLDLPGGFADYHESFEDALRREIREELGLKLTNISYFGSFPNEYRYRRVTYFTIDAVFTCRAMDLSALKPNAEIARVFFAKPSSIDYAAVAFDSARNAIKAYAASLRR